MTRLLLSITVIALMLNVGCNNDDETTPVPSTPSMTATETALLGTWIQDSTISYGANSLILWCIDRNGHVTKNYIGGILNSTVTNNEYYYLTFSNTYWGATGASTGTYKVYMNDNGFINEAPWNVQSNYGGTGKDYIGSVGYIYTLTSTHFEARSSTNAMLNSTVIYYYHKQ